MSTLSRTLLLATLVAGSLSAQDPRLGLSINLLVPTGSFHNTTYGPTYETPYTQQEGYDIGLGAQFTASFALDPRTALRLVVSGHDTRGTNTVRGYAPLNLEHSIFSLGAEMQFFSGSAYRHRGGFIFAGVSADFESFSRSEGEITWDPTDTTRKSRLGGTVGVGRTFGYEHGTRFNVELAFHKTLTGHDPARSEPPSTDFLKLSFGWVF